MTFDSPGLRITRTTILVVLAALVVLLGAAAKHSQFDGPPHHGYLSKAIKMAGARIDPNMGVDSVQYLTSPVSQTTLDTSEQAILPAPQLVCYTSVSVLSPPLRV